MTEARTAVFLAISLRTLQTWRRSRVGPRFVRLSCRSIRYRRADLMAWMIARLEGGNR
jgi:hypothetical protein